ncbi:N2,N2-dimethylguanosine tRNA methyltransferase [Gloeophyllum trabeum ATCC 11539]|uniref:tRNA (guanine(26)-N(2))-dimethyltransferase n=1 Tax=Gloeophyllum trabeum (strain ATCC 11539 / FP-39264 / Madison 617) TaxID=670483 RepID=S7QFQ5_GLOTA|nr:N2,N2-dimethylguanosine tRNA methyltransferase [Gloeophyllum trabeum ATCC 11539]EPQ58267.1 N2,N2-dimethylguanosine tRNA methyltransferase [Gloeophyllum trabeum ATCC 11539]
MSSQSSIVVPEGFTLHTENAAHILLPSSNEAFLNPVQEFNRDMSVACIRVYSEEVNREKEARWKRKQEYKAKKAESGSKNKKAKTVSNSAGGTHGSEAHEQDAVEDAGPGQGPSSADSPELKAQEYRPYTIEILEALSATGLRSIRYAKEIPLVKYVIANDLSPLAVEAMKRNIEINGLGPKDDVTPDPSGSSAEPVLKGTHGKQDLGKVKVKVKEGDACALMYNHRPERSRVDVVDLDPYGTAAPFIDAAVQCVKDGGLLCVTCTDLSVLATTNYPEKCFSNYGGIPVKSEYCHEAALRLVLHAVSTSAARYGRFIQPLLSLSIDFYVRLFIKIKSQPIEVKKAASKTSTYYVCTGCQSFYEQPLARTVEQVHERSGNVNLLFKTHAGPTVPERCTECNSVLHVAGPMWSGPLHDPEFVGKVLEHLEADADHYGTSTRMRGMLTVAKEELTFPFYFTPAKISSFFHCTCPSLDDVASALLHAGHSVSRSHACAGSLKTSASRRDVHDVFRSWIKTHPVKMENVSEKSPAHQLLAKEPSFEANFKRHPLSVTPSAKVKLVRYQQNPTANWGPGTKASSGTKRKRDLQES